MPKEMWKEFWYESQPHHDADTEDNDGAEDTVAEKGVLSMMIMIMMLMVIMIMIRPVESKSLNVGKSLKIGKNRIKSEKSEFIFY